MKLSIKRPETTVEFCLDGQLYAEWAQANAELTEARNMRLADSRLQDPAREAAMKVQRLESLMKENTATFLIRGMKRMDWDRLVAENPPKEGNKADEQRGFNLAGLCMTGIPSSIVSVTKNGEPVDFDPSTEWDALADEMTDSQYEDFQIAILTVNRGRNEVPFSPAAWRETVD